jgi:drug/metabolite transporter (DMT)-like permease
VLTALIAWTVFRENADRRVVLGMVLVVLGGAVLSWQAAAELGPADWVGPAAIVAACIFWAIDNNLTRKVSASDALFIAASKGLIAGIVNTTLALFLGAVFSNVSAFIATMFVGLLGYGVSLVLFVLALRGLGAARTGAYFSTAPFIGAAIAFVFFGETSTPQCWLAAGLMGAGVWLHLTEHHNHDHTHGALAHAHRHTHDAHHDHPHAFEWDTDQPHTHWHEHAALRHKHPHFPDIHHQHPH